MLLKTPTNQSNEPRASRLPTRLRVVRIIDRLNIGGPARHVVWLTAGLDAALFDSTLIAGTVPESEGDMSYFADELGVRPLIVPQMSRELGLRDIVVVWNLLVH